MKHRGIFQRRECQCNSARACFGENKSFRCKFGNMFRTHFEGKVTLLKFVHSKPCVFAKSVVSHFCGKNLTDECIGHFFLTDTFASIASAWIRPCGACRPCVETDLTATEKSATDGN